MLANSLHPAKPTPLHPLFKSAAAAHRSSSPIRAKLVSLSNVEFPCVISCIAFTSSPGRKQKAKSNHIKLTPTLTGRMPPHKKGQNKQLESDPRRQIIAECPGQFQADIEL